MSCQLKLLNHLSHHIIESIGLNGIHYSTLLEDAELTKRYGGVNMLAGEIHKLIALYVVETTKTYSPEDGSDFKLSLTKRGRHIFKDPNHE